MIDKELLRQICEDLKQSQNVISFTGAGISEESGIPTYRSKGGFWTKYDPNKYASIDAFNEDPSYYWNFYKDTRKPILEVAQPNPGHFALSELEKMGKMRYVVTQNIDGLHAMAGSQNVIELHGTTRSFRCKKCEKHYVIEEVNDILETELPPLCRECNGVIRPNVIFFGEMLPGEAINTAMMEAAQADFIIGIGSSMVVYPAAQIPVIAKENGARFLIVNAEVTNLDLIADYVINGKAGEILPEIVNALKAG